MGRFGRETEPEFPYERLAEIPCAENGKAEIPWRLERTLGWKPERAFTLTSMIASVIGASRR